MIRSISSRRRLTAFVIWFGLVMAGPISAQTPSSDAASPAQASPSRLEQIRTRLKAVDEDLEKAIEEQRLSAAADNRRAAGDPDAMAERLDQLEQDVEELIDVQEQLVREAKRDRLNWSGEYRIIVNNVQYTDPKTNKDELSANMWSHRLRLETDYEITPDLRFYGRMVVFKNFGETDGSPQPMDSRSTRYPTDTTVRLERAFLDWFPVEWLALTAGRVATPEGPPAELKENTERNATWGVQMVEGEFESILATLNLGHLLDKSHLRIFYSPFFSHAPIDPLDDSSVYRDSGIDQTHIWGLLLELSAPQWGENLWQIGVVHVPQFRPVALPIPNPTSGELVHPGHVPGSLGSYMMANTLIESKNLLNSRLDLFAAYAYTRLSPNDEAMEYDFGGGNAYRMGLASMGDDEHEAHMVYAGGRYTLANGPYGPRFGAEYNWGSKYHMTWGSPSDTLINKLATRGQAIEAYWIQPIVPDHFFLRTGVVHLRYDHRGSFIGPSQPVDQQVSNAYALVNASW